MTDQSNIPSKKYNERYSRPVTMQLGDLETLQLALAAADDYLLWLVDLRGQKHGAVEVVQRSVKSARALAYELRGPQGEIPTGDYEQAVGASEPKGSSRESPALSQAEASPALEKHLPDSLHDLMWDLGPSRYIIMRALILQAQELQDLLGVAFTAIRTKFTPPSDWASRTAVALRLRSADDPPYQMSPDETTPQRELTLRDFGYAPGNYTFKCMDCAQETIGDKRARRCETCAAQAMRENRSAVKASERGM